jgi:ATP-dependent DNA helicase DinG
VKPRDLWLPFDEWRSGQEEAINEIADCDEQVVMLAAPTSFGKSFTAVGSIMSHIKRSMRYERLPVLDNQPEALSGLCGGSATILTSTKMLAFQYTRDFSYLYEMRGRSNFECLMMPDTNAANGPCTDPLYTCPYNEPYVIAREKSRKYPAVVSNYDYFILSSNSHGGPLKDRDLLIGDEAHLLEMHLARLIEVGFGSRLLRKLGIMYPDIDLNDVPEWQRWAEVVELQINMHVRGMETNKIDMNEEEARNAILNITRFRAGDKDDWVMYQDKRGDVVARPVWVKKYMKQMFRQHGKKLLLMSATLIAPKKYAEFIGIDEPVHVIERDSNIPVENRPMYAVPVLHMAHRGGSTSAQIVSAVDSLLSAYYPLPALVHTQNYKICDMIMKMSRYKNAMLSHKTDDREQVFEEYRNGSGFRVLCSPSMGLGVDFPNIQGLNIIVKLPFPNTEDRQVRARKEQSSEWYRWATTAALVQEYGRGSRAPEHVCDTYILDDNMRWFYNSSRELFPRWCPLEFVKMDNWIDHAIKRGSYIRGIRSA